MEIALGRQIPDRNGDSDPSRETSFGGGTELVRSKNGRVFGQVLRRFIHPLKAQLLIVVTSGRQTEVRFWHSSKALASIFSATGKQAEIQSLFINAFSRIVCAWEMMK